MRLLLTMILKLWDCLNMLFSLILSSRKIFKKDITMWLTYLKILLECLSEATKLKKKIDSVQLWAKLARIMDKEQKVLWIYLILKNNLRKWSKIKSI